MGYNSPSSGPFRVLGSYILSIFIPESRFEKIDLPLSQPDQSRIMPTSFFTDMTLAATTDVDEEDED